MSVDAIRRGIPGASVVGLLRRRARGANDLDDWGLDPELVALVNPVLGLRWDIEVQGAEQLPAVGGGLLAFNRRLGLSEPWVVARGIRQATGRFVRTVGVPDVAPVGTVLRRFGGVLDRPDEVAGLLRAGQLVGLPMARQLRGRETVGHLDPAHLEVAVAGGWPVVPVALVGRELGRSWRIVVGEPLDVPPDAGPLAAVEAAEELRRAAQALLDESLPTSWWF